MKQRLKKHEGLVTVIGALIVFATFVVKDGIRDRYKDWADSIDTAQVHYKLAAELMDLSKGLRENLDDSRALRREVYELKHKPRPRSGEANLMMVEFEQRDIGDAGAEIENISILLRKLPKHDEEQAVLDHVKKDMELVKVWIKDKDKLNYEENTGENFDPNDKTDWNAKVAEDEARIQAEKAKDGQFGGILLQNLQEKIIAKANAERDHYKELDESFKWWSYGLFALGWGIGLLAKWAGIKEGDGGA